MLNIFALYKCARGEIGRRAALRGLCSQERGSSNLLVRTTTSIFLISIFSLDKQLVKKQQILLPYSIYAFDLLIIFLFGLDKIE